MSGKWRIEQLRELVARALELSPVAGQLSGRVQDVPDVRMIRYYTTIGLIDRAAEIRGRTAFYGPKHLRQLVAIKRLQAQGMSLVQVQELLAGVTPQKLARLAELPAGLVDTAVTDQESSPAPGSPAESANTQPAVRRRFWADVPEPATSEVSTADLSLLPTEVVPRPAAVILPLDVGVSLVLEGVLAQQLNDDVVAALGPAMAALREALARAGLSQRSGNGGARRSNQPSDQEGEANEPQNNNV